MTWLTPMTAIVAGAVAAPLLVLLYFLKLKRRETRISSTLLWKRAVQDLQVNAPFQRLRRNILLLLQLLALLGVVAMLGSPMLRWRGPSGKRYVLLIDRSASMEATDVRPTRLAAAKAMAKAFVKTLRSNRGFGDSDEAMVMAFADEPQVLCPFVADAGRLSAAIDSIQPVDAETRIAEALRIAQAFATPTDSEAQGRSTAAPAQLVLFTDGKIQDAEQITLRREAVTVYQVGQSANNIAVVALQARRSFEDPEQAAVFAGLANFEAAPAECDVQLSLDGRVISLQHVTLPAAKTAGKSAASPGQAGVTFGLKAPGGGVLEVRALPARPDALAADNAAWAVLAAPKRLAVLLVTPGNLVVEEAIRSLPLAKVRVMSPGEFDAVDAAQFEMTRAFDVVILDRAVPRKLPRCGYLVLGPAPDVKGVSSTGPDKDQFILDWRTSHPALKFINLENIYARNWWKYTLPPDAHLLAESDRGPALAALSREGRSFLFVNFDVLSSNWPFRPGFVMFLYNAITFLGSPAAQTSDSVRAGGSSISVRVPAGARGIRILRPDGRVETRDPDPGGTVRYTPLDRTGVYRVHVAAGKSIPFAVNLFSAAESDIAPAPQVAFDGESVPVQKAEVAPANRDIKRHLLLFALAALCVEWFIYNKKVQI